MSDARLQELERENAAMRSLVEAGLMVGRCPLCRMSFEPEVYFAYRHEVDCPLREGFDVRAIIAAVEEARAEVAREVAELRAAMPAQS